jgi:hypothetical protein
MEDYKSKWNHKHEHNTTTAYNKDNCFSAGLYITANRITAFKGSTLSIIII